MSERIAAKAPRDRVGAEITPGWSHLMASNRSHEAADGIIRDLKSRTAMRLQISTDGLPAYLDAVLKNYNYGDADLGQITKVYYANSPQPGMSPNSAASRYSPGRVVSVERVPVFGMPITKHISTSYMARWNLTLRMGQSALH